MLICGNVYLSFFSFFLRLILGKADLDDILVLIDFLCAECRHAYINRDDGFCPVSLFRPEAPLVQVVG